MCTLLSFIHAKCHDTVSAVLHWSDSDRQPHTAKSLRKVPSALNTQGGAFAHVFHNWNDDNKNNLKGVIFIHTSNGLSCWAERFQMG